MSYISDLRKYIGHAPIINVGSTVLIFNDKNELLLNLRSDTNDWGIPGGGKEINETLEECAIREIKEETNLDIKNLSLITVLSGKDYYYVYPNDDECDSVIALYKVDNYSGELRINDGESKILKFYSLDNLPTLETRAKIIIDKIKNGELKFK